MQCNPFSDDRLSICQKVLLTKVDETCSEKPFAAMENDSEISRMLIKILCTPMSTIFPTFVHTCSYGYSFELMDLVRQGVALTNFQNVPQARCLFDWSVWRKAELYVHIVLENHELKPGAALKQGKLDDRFAQFTQDIGIVAYWHHDRPWRALIVRDVQICSARQSSRSRHSVPTFSTVQSRDESKSKWTLALAHELH